MQSYIALPIIGPQIKNGALKELDGERKGPLLDIPLMKNDR